MGIELHVVLLKFCIWKDKISLILSRQPFFILYMCICHVCFKFCKVKNFRTISIVFYEFLCTFAIFIECYSTEWF